MKNSLINFENFITFLGFVALSWVLYKTVVIFRRIVYVHLLARPFGHVIDLSKYGKWAVVTGSTDGIGKGYAKELARRGLNIFLISRSQNKLDATAKEILDECSNIEVKTLAFDYSASTISSYDTIRDALAGYEVGILVNNVGVSTDCPDYFLTYPGGDKFWRQLIDVNCFSVTEMTYIVLPQMIKRKKGIIINMSSASGFCPIPFLTLYSASKTFISFFTLGLIGEYKNSGVIFQCVYPALVATNMSRMKPSLIAVDPNSYARAALDTVGLESETTGCFNHAVQYTLAYTVPQWVYLWFARQNVMYARDKFMRDQNKSQ